jgi:hypothetical protein
MIVVEGARNKIGRDVLLSVTSSLQTSAGKMIFGRFDSFAGQGGNHNSHAAAESGRGSPPSRRPNPRRAAGGT